MKTSLGVPRRMTDLRGGVDGAEHARWHSNLEPHNIEKLRKGRSRLHRGWYLQVNTHVLACFEMYTFCTPLHRPNLRSPTAELNLSRVSLFFQFRVFFSPNSSFSIWWWFVEFLWNFKFHAIRIFTKSRLASPDLGSFLSPAIAFVVIEDAVAIGALLVVLFELRSLLLLQFLSLLLLLLARPGLRRGRRGLLAFLSDRSGSSVEPILYSVLKKYIFQYGKYDLWYM